MTIGSAAAALLWGVGWANIVHGVPIDAQMEYTGSFFTLLNPYALLGGVATLLIFLAHGSVFLTLRTEGEMGERARAIAGRVMPPAAAAGIAFLAWTVAAHRGGVDVARRCSPRSPRWRWSPPRCWRAAVPAAPSPPPRARSSSSSPRSSSTSSRNAMVSSTSAAYDMTLNASSSSHYTLVVMTVVAALLVPVVLVYQAWTYWVFRQRVSAADFGDVRNPLDLLGGQEWGRRRCSSKSARPGR